MHGFRVSTLFTSKEAQFNFGCYRLTIFLVLWISIVKSELCPAHSFQTLGIQTPERADPEYTGPDPG